MSVTFPGYSVVLFPIFPSFIFHHVRFISGLFRRLISGNFRHSYFIMSVHFRIIPSSDFRKFPAFTFHDFRLISGLFRRLISGNFHHSYFIIPASFPDYSVVLFPKISVIHISSFPFHFRIILSSYFRKFPSFIFHHSRFISGLFRRPPVLAVSVIFDLGLFSLETETQQYVLLGISGLFRHSYFIISASFYSVLRISLFPLHVRIIPSFVFHHFRFISGLFRHSYSIISVSFPDYSVFVFHHFRFISGVILTP